MKGKGTLLLCTLTVLTITATLLSSARIQAADGPTDTNWMTYNGTVNGQRYSSLDQINVQNVASLKEVCRLKVDDSGTFQAGLLQINGTLYMTNAHDTLAVDATNCTLRWRHVYKSEQEDIFQVNRGVAYANGKLFRGTPDARMLAIDAATGKTIWQQQVGDPGQGEFFSSVPAVWQGLIISGSAGSDWGIRGRIMAYEQETGREVWRFYTIPRGREVGAETWTDRDTARYGGGGSWTTYTLDMSSGEVFVPVGNPAPDFVPSYRSGANLFTDSMVVLDARTGALKWWFQMLANDGLDLDLAAAPMLFWNSKGRPMVAIGSKDGYLYSVDRETKKQIFKTQVTTVKIPEKAPNAKGVYSCPGPAGGVEWNGPAYDPVNKQIVVGAVDWCATIKSDEVEFQPGKFFLGGTWEWDAAKTGWVTAVHQDTGAVQWKYHTDAPVVSAITPTAGGVTFAGDLGGDFFAFDSKTGKVLLKIATGGGVAGGIITYALGGTQYIAITSGNVSRMSFGESGKPSVVIYALPEHAKSIAPAPQAAASPTQPTTTAALTAPNAGRGKDLYGKNCAACHGSSGEGGSGPVLKGVSKKLDFAGTVKWIESPSEKMPKLYPSILDAQAVTDVATYVLGLQ
ncbi:MAG: c-type cytochrome [Deltaproteobacteria bacterium]|nr:c-type cytochrome [Deltaproteobacteria bacterium]